jgi:hypothetical protein
MSDETVFFDYLPQSDGSKRYAVRIDPNKITKGYEEEQFWQLMLHCFSAVDSARVSFIEHLEAKGSMVLNHSLSPQCRAHILQSE